MKKSAIIMGMPVGIHIVDSNVSEKDISAIFDYLKYIDELCSTYKESSEISRINRGELRRENALKEVKKILSLCEETKKETHGYFDMMHNEKIDPSGIVKGYAISQAIILLKTKGYTNFSVEIAGDAEVIGTNEKNEKWHIGIQNPFNLQEIVKVVAISNRGIATSGNYKQGKHIYNPHTQAMADEIASITVIGPTAYDADRFATAAFAMGENGIQFIETRKGYEAYMITKNKKAIMTTGFEVFTL